MSKTTHPTVPGSRHTPALAVAILFGATLLAGTARAEMAVPDKIKTETLDERIETLHGELQITAAEETDWSHVAEAMRDNANTMEALSAEKSEKAPESVTAVDDLEAYQKFAQAHADGLKNLVASFVTLYATMPDDQKKRADRVFETFGHNGEGSSHG